MNTYIIESQGYYKIGKAKDIDNRIEAYNTHNPSFKLLHVVPFDCEYFLHKYFEDKRFKYEWFQLSIDDVTWIKDNHELLSQHSYEKIRLIKQEEDLEKKILQGKLSEQRVQSALRLLGDKRVLIEEKLRIKQEKDRMRREQEEIKRIKMEEDTQILLNRLISECPECFTK